MTAAAICIAVLVFAWAYWTPAHRSAGNIQQRASKEDLEQCARIARRRISQTREVL